MTSVCFSFACLPDSDIYESVFFPPLVDCESLELGLAAVTGTHMTLKCGPFVTFSQLFSCPFLWKFGV